MPDAADSPRGAARPPRAAAPEHAAAWSEERLRFALDVAKLGQWDLNLATGEAFRSLRHDAIFGYPEGVDEWTYERFLAHVLPQHRSAVDAAFEAATVSGGDWDFECRIRRADGALRWIWARGRVWHGAGGEPGRMLGVVGDITERKDAEATARGMSARLLQAGEVERRRMAREIHDELGGLLTSLQMSLSMNPARDPVARAELAEAQKLVHTMVERVREISLDLRPSLLDDLGLKPALEQLVQRFRATTHIAVTFRCELDDGTRFSPAIETTAYRIVQSALTNVARHAATDRVQVLCNVEPGRLVLHVADQGAGFDTAAVDARISSGLEGMRERAALVGGTAVVTSTPGAGTRITATLPTEP